MDRYPTRDPAPRDNPGVSRMNPELLESGSQPRRLESSSVLTGRDFQTVGGIVSRAGFICGKILQTERLSYLGRHGGVQSGCIFHGGFDITQGTSDRVSFVDLGRKANQH